MIDRAKRPRVYLSSVAIGSALSAFVARELQLGGCDTFSLKLPSAGADVPQHLQGSLRDTDAVFLVASATSVDSQWMPFELGAALALDKPVYVVAEVGLTLPAYLRPATIVREAEVLRVAQSLCHRTTRRRQGHKKLVPRSISTPRAQPA